MDDLYNDPAWDFNEPYLKRVIIDDKQKLKDFIHNKFGAHYSQLVHLYKERNKCNFSLCTSGFKSWKTIDKPIYNLLTDIEKDITGFLNHFLVESQILAFRMHEYNRIPYIKPFCDRQSYNWESYQEKIVPHNRRFLCPFHKEKTASFVYYNKTGNFHCHGCGKTLNFIGVIQTLFDLTRTEALWLLCRYANYPLIGHQISPKKNMALKIEKILWSTIKIV